MIHTASESGTIQPEQSAANPEFGQLNFLRALIDNIDSAILAILAHRAQVVNYIMEYKATHQISLTLSLRRQEIISELLEFTTQLQLDPGFVRQLLEHLFQTSATFLTIPPHPEPHNYYLKNDNILTELNRTLKHLDMSFCSLLSERMQLVKQVGIFKRERHIQPLAQARWEQVLKSKMNLAQSLHLNPEAIRQFYDLIHAEALRIESGLMTQE